MWFLEFSAQVNSATVKVPDTDAKKFNIKEGEASMDCIFYEIVSIYMYLCHTNKKLIGICTLYSVAVFPIAQVFHASFL